MSMVSKRFSKEEADRKKFLNEKSIPQILIELTGGVWKGQEYDLGVKPTSREEVKGVIGLIDVIDSKWPNKFWTGYDELKKRLEKEGYRVRSLRWKDTIKEHIDDINRCEAIVCGDTLGMHIALALKKSVVAIFNCTPYTEIYGYNRMVKVVSPLLTKYIWNRENISEAQSAVSVDAVYDALKIALKSSTS